MSRTKTISIDVRTRRLLAEEEPSQRIRHFPSRRPKPEPIDFQGPSTIRSQQYRPIGRNDRLPSQKARLSPSTSRDRSKPSGRLGKVANPLTPAVENSNRNHRLPPSCLPRGTASYRKRRSPPHSIQENAALARDLETGVVADPLAIAPAVAAVRRPLAHDHRDLRALPRKQQSHCRTWFHTQLSTLCH